MEAKKVPLSSVNADTSVNVRGTLDPDLILTYRAHLDDLPPVIVYEIDNELLLTDGFHRYVAHKREKREQIQVEVRQGTRKEAYRHAAVANTTHGQRLATADLHRAIRRLLDQGLDEHETAAALSITYQGVQFVVRADKVREATGISLKRPSHYSHIYGAPEKDWKRLAVATHHNGWGQTEIKVVREALKSPGLYPDGYIERVLEGKTPPVIHDGGEFKALAVAVKSASRKRSSNDPAAIVWGLLEGIATVKERIDGGEELSGRARKRLKEALAEAEKVTRGLADEIT